MPTPKSSMWLLDPRPDLPTIVRMVEKGFELSEASHAPVDSGCACACHVTRALRRRPTRASAKSGLNRIDGPPRFDYARLAHPPLTFVQEKLKVDERMPPRRPSRASTGSTSSSTATARISASSCSVVYGTVLRALARLGLADAFGNARIPIYCLNLAYPLIPDELKTFCLGKRDVLIVEEVSDYIEQAVNAELRRADIQTRIHGKGALPKAGEYTGESVCAGSRIFSARQSPPASMRRRFRPQPIACSVTRRRRSRPGRRIAAAPAEFLHRLSGTAGVRRAEAARSAANDAHLGRYRLSLVRDLRAVQMGNSILGYGMSLASAAAVAPRSQAPSDLGDGRRRFLAQRPDHRRCIEPVQQERWRADRDAERLHVGDRPAIHAFEHQQPAGLRARHGHRADAALVRRQVAAQGAHLQRRHHGADAEGSDAHRERAEGHHRGRRMPARAPAPRARRGRREAEGRRACGAHQVRRRRRDLHR